MAILELNAVAKSYGDGHLRTEVLKNINLAIRPGEFVAIVGFSGSGKTTLINLMAGLIQPDQGEILFKGRPAAGAGPDRGVVFQSYALMPWLTVYGNIALAVDAVCKTASRAERDLRVRHYVEMVGLADAIGRRPAELSGGMRQRVAVARALALKPDILLLDEPLSALDALTRARLQDEIEAIWKQEKSAMAMITNDVDEAILLADRIIPLTPAPHATLGPEFIVDLPRPRDRAGVNTDQRFKQLRRAIMRYLMAVGSAEESRRDDPPALPALTPILPPALRRALKPAVPHQAERYLEFAKVRKDYAMPAGRLTVVEDFDLMVKKGEFISLIGHSGCGKSTVLSMAAGLTGVVGGGIVLDGSEITMAGPDKGVVFQTPSLLPWLSAYDNVALGVDQVYAHASAKERDDIVRYYLARVGLGEVVDKKAADLSDGMKQRVGIARAFALSPKLLLLDEPFGMLDSLTRWDLQDVLMEVWSRTKVTAVCVTHDVDEAILLADRVVMMTNGPNARIGQIMTVDLPRPRSRAALLEHQDYYRYRRELLSFLQSCERRKSRAHPESASPQQAA